MNVMVAAGTILKNSVVLIDVVLIGQANHIELLEKSELNIFPLF